MKIYSCKTNNIYNVDFEYGKYYTCPECSMSRKKAKAKTFKWHEGNTGFCNHCQTRFAEYKRAESKEYFVPQWKNKTDLTDQVVKWFTGRMISQETLIKMRIHSDKEYMPQTQKDEDVICFPYFRNEKLINTKYRTLDKYFKMVSGAELLWYNYDAIKDNTHIIIVEGEIDALTFIENGFDNVISVPNGAGSKAMQYLDDSITEFEHMSEIYIAVDVDTKGIELRDELIRRLGPERCYICNFKECKDANEYFCTYGGIEFKALKYEKVPVKGIVEVPSICDDIRDLYENGVTCGLKIESTCIDEFITWEPGRLAVVTGIPGSGKSEFVDFIVCKLNILHGLKAAYFTPENYPLKFHYRKLFEKLIGKEFNREHSSEIEYDLAYEHIKDNFFYIMNEDELTFDTILTAAKTLIKSKGVKIFVIDPYNKVDHQFDNKISETQYISKFLDKLITFTKVNQLYTFLVAHPKKMQKGEVPSLYDINGSANFYNKTDYGFTIDRDTSKEGIMTNEVNVYWKKIKYKHLGKQGISELMYNYNNGRFEDKSLGDVHKWDNSNWLIKKLEHEPIENFDPNYVPF